MTHIDVLTLAKILMQKPSVTPCDAGCQVWLHDFLSSLGFTVQQFDRGRVKNLWARYGNTSPLFVFAGHTDVVPVGDLTLWRYPPFEPTVHDNMLFGRGACDMKGGLAAMLAAMAQFLSQKPLLRGSIGFLITSAEEGDDYNDGTPYVMEKLAEMEQIPDYCLVGEPSCSTTLGDTIKVGRRGSLTGHLNIIGKQGHVAYPQLALNPIHHAANALQALTQTTWDDGNAFFPPTSFQITRIHADAGGNNVIPGELNITFNFRYSPVSSAESLTEKIIALLNQHELTYTLEWRHSGLPFLTQNGALLDAAQHAIQTVCGISPELSTSGGTSDGRFIAPYGVDVIELGLINKTIHQINECVTVDSLHQLTAVYEALLKQLLL